MNILVCVRRVPDSTEIKIDPVTGTLIRKGVPSIVNPDDTFALEMALRLKEAQGGTVTLLCMGSLPAEKNLRRCLAAGADKAYLATDRIFGGADTLATSRVLAHGARRLEKEQGAPFDVIFCGKQSTDGDTGQVGPGLAEHLMIAQVTYVRAIHLENGRLIAERETDEGIETVSAALPVLLTVVKNEATPRYPSVMDMVSAKLADIGILAGEELELEASKCGLKGSPTKVRKTYTPSRIKNCKKIEGDLSSQCDELVTMMASKQIL